MASRPGRRPTMATVGAIATLKPRPPSSPRSSLADIGNTNGAAGLLSGKGGVEAEVGRLSSKIMDLMQQLQAKEGECKRLETNLEVARKEAANAKALIASGAPAAASRPQSPTLASSASTSSTRARMPATRPTTGSSPARKDAMVNILSAALREADQMTALKAEELAAARAMIAHRSRGPSPQVAGGDAPAPGVVAKLQAELAEAAEERRNLRAQLQVRSTPHANMACAAHVALVLHACLHCICGSLLWPLALPHRFLPLPMRYWFTRRPCASG